MSNNGYTVIEINGEKIGLKFGMPAIRQFADKLSKKKLISDGSYNELGIAHILYAGYCCNCDIKDTEEVLKFEDFYDFVEAAIADPARIDIIKAVITCFEESQYVKQIVESLNGAETESKKKNGRGMRLKPLVTGSLTSAQTSTSG